MYKLKNLGKNFILNFAPTSVWDDLPIHLSFNCYYYVVKINISIFSTLKIFPQLCNPY